MDLSTSDKKMLLKVKSFIRGYHAYMDDWEPNAEDEYLLKRELNNMNDSNAVAVVQAARRKRMCQTKFKNH